MNKTIIIKDQRYLQHITGEGHPENHHRLEEIYSMLKQDDMKGLFKEILPRAATPEELALIHGTLSPAKNAEYPDVPEMKYFNEVKKYAENFLESDLFKLVGMPTALRTPFHEKLNEVMIQEGSSQEVVEWADQYFKQLKERG